MKRTRIGIDLAKNIVHLVAMDSRGKRLWGKKLARRAVLEFVAPQKPALIGTEACSTAHHCAREMLRLRHEVKSINPRFVTPYRNGNKNDFNDTESICQ